MSSQQWKLWWLFYISLVLTNVGAASYYQWFHFAPPSSAGSDQREGKGSPPTSRQQPAPPTTPALTPPMTSPAPPPPTLDGDLLLLVLATKRLDVQNQELEKELKQFLTDYHARIIGRSARIVGKGMQAEWGANERKGLAGMVPNSLFEPDDVNPAFQAAFDEMRQIAARRPGKPFHGILLWDSDINPDIADDKPPVNVAKDLGCSLVWLSNPPGASKRLLGWFKMPPVLQGPDTKDLAKNLSGLADKYRATK